MDVKPMPLFKADKRKSLETNLLALQEYLSLMDIHYSSIKDDPELEGFSQYAEGKSKGFKRAGNMLKDILDKKLDKVITKKRMNEDEYEVMINGKVIGRVYKGWTRVGGDGWTFNGTVHTYRTLKEAVICIAMKRG